MFSSLTSTGTPTSIDPEEERKPPPEPTVVYFPQNDIHLTASDQWITKPPNLFKAFGRITKPSDVRLAHLSRLNVTIQNDIALEDFVPKAPNGSSYLPPKYWTKKLDPSSRKQVPPETPGHLKGQVLSNGFNAPESDTFVKYAAELACETQDGLRAIGRRKPRKGRLAPVINHYQVFWAKMEVLSQFWDSSLDNYYEKNPSTPSSPKPSSPTTPKGLRKMSLFISERSNHSTKKPDTGKNGNTKPEGNKRYTGWRKDKGSRMPDGPRTELVRAFLAKIAESFGCHVSFKNRSYQVEIKSLLIPVTVGGVIWRSPEDKLRQKQGFFDGPLMGLQCRGETAFTKDPESAALDTAREMACLLMIAQERAREGKTKITPGQGAWYTTRRRWGGGPGGEFGEAEGDRDSQPFVPTTRRVSTPGSWPKKMTEEEIWKELKPNTGLWDNKTNYIAVGKDRTIDHDTVFMVSGLFHHISILKLEVHPLYLEYLLSGTKPPFQHAASPDDPDAWYKPKVTRTRWFDLLSPEDRLEAYRGIWGIMSYLMRPDDLAPRPKPANRSGSENIPLFDGLKALRRKSTGMPAPVPDALAPGRSNSVS